MGSIQVFQTYITPFHSHRNVRIYLPDGWERWEERYPVLYMYDAQNLFFDHEASFGMSWRLKDFLDHWDKKLIVVGLDCSSEGYSRLQEYSPYHITLPGIIDADGTGQALMDWMVRELKPYIDQRYPTIPFRECTAIAGASMGGLMSLYTVSRYNHLFSKAACLSSSFVFEYNDMWNEVQNTQYNPDTRIYMSWGSDEGADEGDPNAIARCNVELDHLLYEKGCSPYLFFQQGGRHNEIYWRQQLRLCMDFLWK